MKAPRPQPKPGHYSTGRNGFVAWLIAAHPGDEYIGYDDEAAPCVDRAAVAAMVARGVKMDGPPPTGERRYCVRLNWRLNEGLPDPFYTVGSAGVGARNHAICEGASVVAMVNGGGYPAGVGWSQGTENRAREMVRKLNAPNLLPVVRSQRLMLYAWKAQRENMALGPHPELDQAIADCETAIAIAEDRHDGP